LPGEIEVSTRDPLWSVEKRITVEEGKPTKILLHREVEKKIKVAGKLILDDNVKAGLENAEIQAGSIDSKYDDEQKVKCNANGTFSFEILASEVGIFARTADGLAAGWTKTADLDKPLKLKLKPTANFEGQLLGDNDQPLAGKTVQASFSIDGTRSYDARRSALFRPEPVKAVTDAQGNFTLKGVSIEMKTNLAALAVLDSGRDRDRSLGEVYLDSNDSRPRTVFRIGKKSTPRSEPLTLADRFKATLRDCKLSGYRMLLVLTDDKKDSASFAKDNFSGIDINADAGSFMPLIVTNAEVNRDPATAAFLKDHNWQRSDQVRVAAYALDKDGNELAHLELNSLGTNSAAKVSSFVHDNAPPKHEADAKWNEAFAEAKRTNRRVWVRISGRYCGPCFSFARWLDDQSKLLEKDYVMLKIDDGRDKNAESFIKRVTADKSHGIPFHAIFDKDEKRLIDSAGPLGNIGSPGGLEGLRHLRKMITTTRQNLSDAEIDQIVESKNDE
jgi:hypothetical protein